VLVVGICSCLRVIICPRTRNDRKGTHSLASPALRPVYPRVSDLHRKKVDFASIVKFDRFFPVGPNRVARG
jgi:hypothetical protein